jgi:hypothetical protein
LEVFADVPHRQWVFTIPKRLRIYFRFDRSLPGKLCRVAYDTVCDVFKLEIDCDCGVPAMVGAVQTFGDLVHWHSHIHAVVAEGVYTDNGRFLHIPGERVNTRPPPVKSIEHMTTMVAEPRLDYEFFHQNGV